MEKLNTKALFSRVESDIFDLKTSAKKPPKLVTVRLGDDPGSIYYENILRKDCQKYGIDFNNIVFEENTEKLELIDKIQGLNADDEVDGIIIFKPLQVEMAEDVYNSIEPSKDCDGVNDLNFHRVFTAKDMYNLPQTAVAIYQYLNWLTNIESKDILIINRSRNIGLPLSQLLTRANATVTLAHSKTRNLEEKIANSEIIVSAIGKGNILKPSDIKEGAVIIDMGFFMDENGRVEGDFDIENLENKNISYMPSNNGIGKLTRAYMLKHLYIKAGLKDGK